MVNFHFEASRMKTNQHKVQHAKFPNLQYSFLTTLTTLCLLSSTINKSLRALNPLRPPNSAALFSPTWVRVNVLHGGGGCPVKFGELHSPGDITYTETKMDEHRVFIITITLNDSCNYWLTTQEHTRNKTLQLAKLDIKFCCDFEQGKSYKA